MRVRDVLQRARQIGVDRLDAQLLLARRLERPRSWLLAHDDHEIDPPRLEAFLHDAARRASGWPLAYLVGRQEFFGLAFQVSPAVLVPRPETELLVEWAMELMPPRALCRVVDLGTGSGAVAIALAVNRPGASITATDIDGGALSVAAANRLEHGVSVELVRGHWWQAVAGRRFDLAVSNPPYVADADPHLDALAHEPRRALASGPLGLDAVTEIVGAASGALERGGWLLLEHGFDQSQRVRDLLAAHGFSEIRTRQDLAGLDRCTGGRAPA